MSDESKINNAINSIKDWLITPEGVYIAFNAGFERTLRDKLLYQLQINFKDKLVVSERSFKTKNKTKKETQDKTQNETKKSAPRIDIAICNDSGKCEIGFEIKTNCLSQLKEITKIPSKFLQDELKRQNLLEIDKEIKARAIYESDRWSKYLKKKEKEEKDEKEGMSILYTLHLVINIEEIPCLYDKYNLVNKYVSCDQNNKYDNYVKYLKEYFENIKEIYTYNKKVKFKIQLTNPDNYKFSQSISKPVKINIEYFLFLLKTEFF